MNHYKLINTPRLSENAEGKLKGGFSGIRKSGTQGGQNQDCGNNEVCFDNKICWNNKTHCQGNYSDSNCGSGTARSTGTSASPSSMRPAPLNGNIFSF